MGLEGPGGQFPVVEAGARLRCMDDRVPFGANRTRYAVLAILPQLVRGRKNIGHQGRMGLRGRFLPV